MKKLILLVFAVLLFHNVRSQTTLRLGINFPMRNPETANVAIYMDLVTESGAQMVRQLTFGDVVWPQIEPLDNQWNFTYADSVFLGYPDLNYTGTLYSLFLQDTAGYQVPWKACTDGGNPACRWIAARDSNDTKQYLDTTIHRYGNIIKYWELGNEVENHSFPESFPLPQMIQFFDYSYGWIKSVDPGAKVVIPSFIGTFGVPMQEKYDWLRDFFTLGGGSYIDIIGYHDYNSWWTLPLHLDSVISVRNQFGYQTKPVWLTESSVSSTLTSITPSYASVDEQAADVWRRSSLFWSKGGELYIWHSLWSSGPPSEWQEFGIVNHLGKKKKSFHSYKLLTEELISFASAELISYGVINDDNESGGEGVWVVKFIVGGQDKWVMWSPDNQTYTLTPSVNTEYVITHVVPSFISPDGQIAAFTRDSVIVNAGGSYAFALTTLPILVETQNITSIPDQSFRDVGLIFPNPADSYFSVKVNSPINTCSNIVITDVAGRPIYRGDLKTKNSMIKTSDWPEGIYFYEINSGENKKHGKILILH